MKILGYHYTLVEDSTSDHMGAFGRHHAKLLTIQIATGLAPQQRVSTVLHELLEALNYSLALGLEHHVIMALESGLHQVLTDNGVDLTPLTREID